MSESHYIGLDVSARTVNLCVVDHNGRTATRLVSRCAALPKLRRWLEAKIEDRHVHLVAKVNALRAMKTKKISDATSFGADLNKSYVKYFEDCGIGVAAMEGVDDVRVRGGIATRHRAFVDQGSAG